MLLALFWRKLQFVALRGVGIGTGTDGKIYRLHVTFIDKDGDRHEFEVAEGDNLLDIAQANELEMEGEFMAVLSTLFYSRESCWQ